MQVCGRPFPIRTRLSDTVPLALPPSQLTLGTGALSGPGENRQGADWVTSYLDRDMRVGRAKSGNTFLFRKKA